ncbi:hypothetical protein HPB50_007185 [Hyalomma asiaticum]|uniref:Uncharacterized protein n=1 Tax=Hyalomma asiaticum TaxID=266040 RepID=A0ACB7RHP9_HYAAI|nr:hypothetical protein HPB50_007185 [Hyalomma asiaticum]
MNFWWRRLVRGRETWLRGPARGLCIRERRCYRQHRLCKGEWGSDRVHFLRTVDGGASMTTGRYVIAVVHLVKSRDFSMVMFQPTTKASQLVSVQLRSLRPPGLDTRAQSQMTQTAAHQMTVAIHVLNATRFCRCTVVLQSRNGKTDRRSARGRNCVTHYH